MRVKIAVQHAPGTARGQKIPNRFRRLGSSIVLATNRELGRGVNTHLDTLARSA